MMNEKPIVECRAREFYVEIDKDTRYWIRLIYNSEGKLMKVGCAQRFTLANCSTVYDLLKDCTLDDLRAVLRCAEEHIEERHDDTVGVAQGPYR